MISKERLEDEQVKEMLEHQEAMDQANITITNLQDRVDKLERALIDSDLELRVCYKALELACEHIESFSDGCYYCPKNQYCQEKCNFYGGEIECINWLIDYFRTKAKEILKNE